GQRLLARLTQAGEEVATTAVNVDEQLSGLLAAVHARHLPEDQVQPYAELIERIEFLAGFLILPWDVESSGAFHQKKAAKIRVGTMDLKIACISLVHDATLLTRNMVDFSRIPGLRVENWLD
ncbi:MAG TPA: nucleic acid-binding protein, partial [Verrucomicrobiales bacterium]|nr:nucleic acid-binding protein [Verrucomicrobiales bacterium]